MFRFNKKIDTLNYEEIKMFYLMLNKYKQQHPCFDVNKVIIKLFPNLDLSKINAN